MTRQPAIDVGHAPAERVPATGRRVVRLVTAGAVAAMFAALALALLLGGGAPQAPPLGIVDGGRPVGWGVPVARVLLDASLAVAAGAVLLPLVLLRGDRPVAPVVTSGARRLLLVAAGVWVAAAAALALLSLSDFSGLPLATAADPALLARHLTGSVPGGAQLALLGLGVVLVALAAGGGPLARGRAGAGAAVVVLAAVPLAVAGHSIDSLDWPVAVPSLVLHVLAAATWVGGLVALLLVASRDRDALVLAAGRFSTLAVPALGALVIGGVLNAWTRLGDSVVAWDSGYGAVLIAKVVALTLLGAAGWVHRRRTLPLLGAGQRFVFARLAAAEVVVMAVAMGLAVALARTEPPEDTSEGTLDRDHLAALGGASPLTERLAPGDLLERFVPDPVVWVGVALAAAVYAAAWSVVARRGVAWPVGRAVAAGAGLVLVLVALVSGLAPLAAGQLGPRMLQLALLSVGAPALLAAGRPVQLLALATGRTGRAPALVRELLTPPVATTFAATLLVVALLTPVNEAATSSHAAHLALAVASLAAGAAFFTAVRPGPGVSTRSAVASALLLVLTWLAVAAVLVAVRDDITREWGVLSSPQAGGADLERRSGALWAVTAAQWVLLVVLGGRWLTRGDRTPGPAGTGGGVAVPGPLPPEAASDPAGLRPGAPRR